MYDKPQYRYRYLTLVSVHPKVSPHFPSHMINAAGERRTEEVEKKGLMLRERGEEEPRGLASEIAYVEDQIPSAVQIS